MINILHLFPNLMNLYGDYGNRVVLTRYLRSAGVGVTEILEDSFEFCLTDAHCILIGPGTERAQERALELLQPHANLFAASVEMEVPILLTGNASELPVKLGLYPFCISPAKDRITGDVIGVSKKFPKPVIGYFNHMAEMTGVLEPLFNNSLGPIKNEGYFEGNMLATYLIGPLLVRNPHILRFFGQKVLEHAGLSHCGTIEPIAEAAYEKTLQNLQKRL